MPRTWILPNDYYISVFTTTVHENTIIEAIST